MVWHKSSENSISKSKYARLNGPILVHCCPYFIYISKIGTELIFLPNEPIHSSSVPSFWKWIAIHSRSKKCGVRSGTGTVAFSSLTCMRRAHLAISINDLLHFCDPYHNWKRKASKSSVRRSFSSIQIVFS